MAPGPQHPPSRDPAGATLTTRGHRHPPAPRNRDAPGLAQPVVPTETPPYPRTEPPHAARAPSAQAPGMPSAMAGVPAAASPPPSPAAPYRRPVLAASRGRVQRSRRKATCVPGRSLPPIPPRRGGCEASSPPQHPAPYPARPPCPALRCFSGTPKAVRGVRPRARGFPPGQDAGNQGQGSSFFIQQRGQPPGGGPPR